MNKVYVLLEKQDSDTTNIIGIVTNIKVAEAFENGLDKVAVPYYVDDPNLLDRIAKENV